MTNFDAKSSRCYTSNGSWSLASPWILLHGRTTYALEAGQATRANRLTAGPFFARLAFLFAGRSFVAVARA